MKIQYNSLWKISYKHDRLLRAGNKLNGVSVIKTPITFSKIICSNTLRTIATAMFLKVIT